MKESKKYYWTDIESGQRFECSKEYYEHQIKQWDACVPKFKNSVGIPMIFGTLRNIPTTFEELFKNTNIKPTTNEQGNTNYFFKARNKE